MVNYHQIKLKNFEKFKKKISRGGVLLLKLRC